MNPLQPAFAMRTILLVFLAIAASNVSAQTSDGVQTSRNNERLRKGLEQFPQADTNKDGILTMEEGLAFLAKAKKNSASATSAKKPAGPAPTITTSQSSSIRSVISRSWKGRSRLRLFGHTVSRGPRNGMTK